MFKLDHSCLTLGKETFIHLSYFKKTGSFRKKCKTVIVKIELLKLNSTIDILVEIQNNDCMPTAIPSTFYFNTFSYLNLNRKHFEDHQFNFAIGVLEQKMCESTGFSLTLNNSYKKKIINTLNQKNTVPQKTIFFHFLRQVFACSISLCKYVCFSLRLVLRQQLQIYLKCITTFSETFIFSCSVWILSL